MNYYKCNNCGSLTEGWLNNCPSCGQTHYQITEAEYYRLLDELKTDADVDEDIAGDIMLKAVNPDLKQQLRYCRSVISGLVEQCWEMGGYTLGENEFENLSVIKDAREQLKEIEEHLK